jgi:rsbT co-antagonist protein RsbR
MTSEPGAAGSSLITQHAAAIIQDWLTDVILVCNRGYLEFVDDEQLREHVSLLLDELVVFFAAHLDGTASDAASEGWLKSGDQEPAGAGFTAVDSKQYALALNYVLTVRLVTELRRFPSRLAACLTLMDGLLDRLPLVRLLTEVSHSMRVATPFLAVADMVERFPTLGCEASLEAQDGRIARQHPSLCALSAPVICLCDRVLLLPVAGEVDTMRAGQISGYLLAAISRFDAVVAVIDVTGVPVLDASAVAHVMKLAAMARLPGACIVISGIGHEQVEAVWGACPPGVTLRATLRDGVAEALQMIDRDESPPSRRVPIPDFCLRPGSAGAGTQRGPARVLDDRLPETRGGADLASGHRMEGGKAR